MGGCFNCHNTLLWKLLFVFCVCFKLSLGAFIRQNVFQHLRLRQVSQQGEAVVFRRQEATPTESTGSSTDAAEFFSNYWFIFVVVLLFVVIVTVFVCACVVTVKKRSHHSLSLELNSRGAENSRSLHPQRSVDEHSLPQHTTRSSSAAGESPISLSVGPTPIPSPQPSAASSQRSYRSQGGKRRRNHSSGHVSSSSDETIRAFHSTTSLMSHGSSQGGHPRLLRTESTSSGEKGSHYRHSGRHDRHKRATSNPHIKVLPSDGHSFYSAPSSSMQSMESVRSTHSGSQRTLVDVDVTVHLGVENDHETRKEIAAALAESARQLAQSAADFDQEDSYSVHGRRSSSQLSYRSSMASRRQLFPNHSSSVSLGHDRSYSPMTPPIVSLDRPRTLERPHHTLPTRGEVARRNSLTRAPPPESPLRICHSSQRMFSNTAKLPPHMRVSRIRSLEDAGAPLSQRQISLDNLHSSPSPPHPLVFSPKTTLADGQLFSVPHPPPHHHTTASLDFSSMGQSSSFTSSPEGVRVFNGVHSPRSHAYVRNDGRTHFVESDHGVSPDSGMGNGDYGTGTESSSSTLRSSHVENRDRLSRLSEKSMEYLNSNDSTDTSVGMHSEAVQMSKRNSNHGFPASPHKKNSRSDVSDGIRDKTVTSSKRRCKQSNTNMEPDYPAQGNSSSGSQASLDDNSTASGYAATGSASSVDSVSMENSHESRSRVIHSDLESQFSYPLEKLLSQPLSYDIDCDDISPAPLSLDAHHHYGNKQSYNNGRYQSQSSIKKVQASQNSYSLDFRNRARSETKLLSPHSRVPQYHTSHAGQSSYQSASITVDV